MDFYKHHTFFFIIPIIHSCSLTLAASYSTSSLASVKADARLINASLLSPRSGEQRQANRGIQQTPIFSLHLMGTSRSIGPTFNNSPVKHLIKKQCETSDIVSLDSLQRNRSLRSLDRIYWAIIKGKCEQQEQSHATRWLVNLYSLHCSSDSDELEDRFHAFLLQRPFLNSNLNRLGDSALFECMLLLQQPIPQGDLSKVLP